MFLFAGELYIKLISNRQPHDNEVIGFDCNKFSFKINRKECELFMQELFINPNTGKYWEIIEIVNAWKRKSKFIQNLLVILLLRNFIFRELLYSPSNFNTRKSVTFYTTLVYYNGQADSKFYDGIL